MYVMLIYVVKIDIFAIYKRGHYKTPICPTYFLLFLFLREHLLLVGPHESMTTKIGQDFH